MPTAIVLLAEGAEEMETVITVDVLRRGGVDVTVAGVDGSEPVKCSRGVNIKPDKSLADAGGQTYDVVVCPGGLGGAKKLAESAVVGKLLKDQDGRQAVVAAICAGPTAFIAHKVAEGRNVTSYPGLASKFQAPYKYCDERVVRDGHVITSRGPGTTFEFALEILRAVLNDDKKVKEIGEAMLLK